MAAVDDSLLDAFDRDGFVVVEDFFDATELELFGSIVDRAVKDRVGEDSGQWTTSRCMSRVFSSA